MRLAFAFLIPVLAATGGIALAESSFDGQWNVGVVTESGGCETGYLLPIRVVDGNVSYAGRVNTTATGSVSDNGAVTVEFLHDRHVVKATGAVTGARGSGKWVSPTLQCAGRWSASRG